MSVATQPSPETAVAVSLPVEITATVRIRQTVNLVTHFQNLPEVERDRYRSLLLAEYGFDAEWERPVAFLWPSEEEVVPMQMTPASTEPTWGDIDTADIRLRSRDAVAVHGREAAWTRADFDALAAQVPWIGDFYSVRTGVIDPADLARRPGPDDVPLFEV